MLGRLPLVAAALAVFASGCAEEAEDVAPPLMPAPAPAPAATCETSTVNYVTNVYMSAAMPPSRQEEVRSPESTGLATCDSYLETTSRCARAVTANADAIARFDRAAEITRNEARIVTSTGDAAARGALSARCEAALHAYDEAPCAPP